MIIPILFLLFAVILGSIGTSVMENFNPAYYISAKTAEFPLSPDMNVDERLKDNKFGPFMGWREVWRNRFSNYEVVEDKSMKEVSRETYFPGWPLMRDDTN